MGDPLLPNPVLIFEYIESVLRRLQFLLKFLPPGRVGKIPCSHDVDPLPPRPEIQMLRRTVPACRPGVTGVDM